METNLEASRLAVGLVMILVLGLSAVAIGMAIDLIDVDPRYDHDLALPPAPGPHPPCQPFRTPAADTRLADGRLVLDVQPVGA